MKTLFLLLCDVLANTIRSSSTGVPVVQLSFAGVGPDLKAHVFGKARALLGFNLEDEEGNLLEDDLGLQLAGDARSSEDLVLIVQLVIRSGRPGLSAGEILESVANGLTARKLQLGEEWSVRCELEKTVHAASTPSAEGCVDHFAVRYALALVKAEAKKPA